ncbi:MAG: putative integron cassette protein [Gemmataceae bacterium]|nr:putative integron cassette protein [Gemmataceae bacterium]
MCPEELLDGVHDRASFVAFVDALAAEREKAEELERAEPVRYQLGGALGWQNGTISTFLQAALACFERNPGETPSWRFFAEFLYFGKIYE